MSRPRAGRIDHRRRGATYTLVVVASSLLIVITAGLLLQSSGHALVHAARQGQAAQAREAAWGGVRWALYHAAQGGAPDAKALLRLHQVEVEVGGRAGADDGKREVTVRARSVDVETTLVAQLERVDGAWRTAAFTVESRERAR